MKMMKTEDAVGHILCHDIADYPRRYQSAGVS